MLSAPLLRLLYASVVLLILLAEVTSNRLLLYVTKPLLMPLLFWLSAFTPDRRVVERKPIFLVALVFAWLGDVLLMIGGLFLPGLGAFLVMQWGYSVVFWPEIRLTVASQRRPQLVLTVLAIGAFIFHLLLHVQDAVLIVALVVYGLSIGLMLLFAIIRGVEGQSYGFVAWGALLFVLSDALIAHNRFVASVPAAGFWIMSTYMLAQYLIVEGMLKKSGDPV